MVRGRGYLHGVADIENVVLRSEKGVPLRLADVARVELVPDERRGITELNGEGEVAGGIVLQRYGSNALTVIENTKRNIDALKASLGVRTRAVRNRTLRANRLRTYATRRSPAGIRSDRNPFGI